MALDADFITHRKRLRSGVGLSNIERFNDPGHVLNGLSLDHAMRGIPLLHNYFGYAFDPSHYPGPSVAGSAGGFVLTETAAGAGNVNSVAVAQANGGGWILKTDNGDNDTEILQLVGEPYRYTIGKTFTFFIGVQVTDFDGEQHFGMNINDTSPIATLPSDGLFFTKAEGATFMTFHARKAGASTTIALNGALITNNVLRYYAFTVSASGVITVYSGLNPSALTIYGSGLTATAPNTEDLGLHIAIQTGAIASTELWIRALAFGGDL